MRGEFPAALGKSILTVTGERRQESPHRRKLDEVEHDKRLTAGGRVVTKWRACIDYTLDQVWQHIRDTGLPRHRAYDLGNDRVSCALCMMASEGDICRGAEARPDLAERFIRIERDTGFTFRHKRSLEQILSSGLQRRITAPAG